MGAQIACGEIWWATGEPLELGAFYQSELSALAELVRVNGVAVELLTNR